jgi:hypothetical protein
LQVTKDGCPVIFHDDFIYSEDVSCSYFMRPCWITAATIIKNKRMNPQIPLTAMYLFRAMFHRSVSLTFSWRTSFSMVHKMSRERYGRTTLY